jgi:hypothetical protein
MSDNSAVDPSELNARFEACNLDANAREFARPDEARDDGLEYDLADGIPDDGDDVDEILKAYSRGAACHACTGTATSGKTFLAIDIACAIARGAAWMGRNVERGLVVYLATESPASVRRRLRATSATTAAKCRASPSSSRRSTCTTPQPTRLRVIPARQEVGGGARAAMRHCGRRHAFPTMRRRQRKQRRGHVHRCAPRRPYPQRLLRQLPPDPPHREGRGQGYARMVRYARRDRYRD